MNWVHAAVLVVIAQLEHKLDLLVLGHSREQIAPQKKVHYVHLLTLRNAILILLHLQRLKPLKKRIDQVARRSFVGELLGEALVEDFFLDAGFRAGLLLPLQLKGEALDRLRGDYINLSEK